MDRMPDLASIHVLDPFSSSPHSPLPPSLRPSPNIFLLIVIGDRLILSIGFEVIVGDSSKSVVFHTKRGINHPLNVIVPMDRTTIKRSSITISDLLWTDGHSQHPLQAAVEFSINTLHILEGNGESQQLLCTEGCMCSTIVSTSCVSIK